MKYISLKKKVESSTKAVYKKTCLKISIALMFSLLSIETKRTYKDKIKKQAGTGSLWRTPFSKSKYGVVSPPLIA